MHIQSQGGAGRQFSGYSDASKVLRYPEGCGGNDTHELDVSRWQEFSHSFKSWLLYAEPEYGEELQQMEDNPTTVVYIRDMQEGTKRVPGACMRSSLGCSKVGHLSC